MGGRLRTIAKLTQPTGRLLVARRRLYARLDPLLARLPLFAGKRVGK